MLELTTSLDRAGAAGLTVRSIVESAAYLFEFRAEYPELGSRSFVEQMRIERLPPEYTAAWHVVVKRAGEEAAFDLLLPVSVVALCFDDPPAAFAAAVSTLAAADAQRCVEAPLDWMRAVGQRVANDIAVLGSGAEMAERLDEAGTPRHSILLPCIARSECARRRAQSAGLSDRSAAFRARVGAATPARVPARLRLDTHAAARSAWRERGD